MTTTDATRKASAAKRRTGATARKPSMKLGRASQKVSKSAKGISNVVVDKANNGASAARMSEVRAARKSLGGRPKEFKKPKAGWNVRNIERLSRDGIESSDIVMTLELGAILQGSPDKRAAFDELVASGHAEFRIRLQRWLLKSASKGGSNAIKSLASVWLEKFADLQQNMWDQRIAGIGGRIEALIEKHKKAEARNRKTRVESRAQS